MLRSQQRGPVAPEKGLPPKESEEEVAAAEHAAHFVEAEVEAEDAPTEEVFGELVAESAEDLAEIDIAPSPTQTLVGEDLPSEPVEDEEASPLDEIRAQRERSAQRATQVGERLQELRSESEQLFAEGVPLELQAALRRIFGEANSSREELSAIEATAHAYETRARVAEERAQRELTLLRGERQGIADDFAAAAAARTEAEELRIYAEQDRRRAENEHVTAQSERARVTDELLGVEAARAEAEAERGRAEAARAEAENREAAFRQAAEAAERDRTTTEQALVAARRDREIAEGARATAQSEREVAANERDKVQKMREAADVREREQAELAAMLDEQQTRLLAIEATISQRSEAAERERASATKLREEADESRRVATQLRAEAQERLEALTLERNELASRQVKTQVLHEEVERALAEARSRESLATQREHAAATTQSALNEQLESAAHEAAESAAATAALSQRLEREIARNQREHEIASVALAESRKAVEERGYELTQAETRFSQTEAAAAAEIDGLRQKLQAGLISLQEQQSTFETERERGRQELREQRSEQALAYQSSLEGVQALEERAQAALAEAETRLREAAQAQSRADVTTSEAELKLEEAVVQAREIARERIRVEEDRAFADEEVAKSRAEVIRARRETERALESAQGDIELATIAANENAQTQARIAISAAEEEVARVREETTAETAEARVQRDLALAEAHTAVEAVRSAREDARAELSEEREVLSVQMQNLVDSATQAQVLMEEARRETEGVRENLEAKLARAEAENNELRASGAEIMEVAHATALKAQQLAAAASEVMADEGAHASAAATAQEVLRDLSEALPAAMESTDTTQMAQLQLTLSELVHIAKNGDSEIVQLLAERARTLVESLSAQKLER